MTDHCPKCEARHIRRVVQMNFNYCGVCNHRWVIEISKPAYLHATACMVCWGRGNYSKNNKVVTCTRCNGLGWLT